MTTNAEASDLPLSIEVRVADQNTRQGTIVRTTWPSAAMTFVVRPNPPNPQHWPSENLCFVSVRITSSGSRRAYFYEELEVQLVHGSQTGDHSATHALAATLQPE